MTPDPCPCCHGSRTVPTGLHHWRPEEPERFIFVPDGQRRACPGCFGTGVCAEKGDAR